MRSYARLLGLPQLRIEDAVYEPPPSKAAGLFFYLAARGEWVERSHLTGLLYPEADEQHARGSLRQLLRVIRREPYSDGLETDSHRVRWTGESDVAAFWRAIADTHWAEAYQLGRGTFLEGFESIAILDGWLQAERDRLHRAWRRAGLEHSTALTVRERQADAAEVLAALNRSDPFDEDVLCAYLQALAASGQRGRALVVYDAFQQLLRSELQTTPEPRTRALAEHLRQSQVRPGAARAAPSSEDVVLHAVPLPTWLTSFVGRQAELAELWRHLTDSGCHFVAIVGSGGIGKTRLAVELARRVHEHYDVVVCVSLVSISDEAGALRAVADALGLPAAGPRAPIDLIVQSLADRRVLLMLDNIEQLPPAHGVLGELTSRLPALQLLVTSRERLAWPGGRTLALLGLPLQEAGETPGAVRLFLERAALDPGQVTDEGRVAITRLCALLDGVPLAIELAAGWHRLMTPTEIADRLDAQLDLLAAESLDRPARHRSLRAIFDSSWDRLSPAEQAALCHVSVFAAGFTLEAADAIAGVGPHPLLALCDKSFLSRDADGRFRQHVLLRRDAAVRSMGLSSMADVRRRHASYYLDFAARLAPALRGYGRLEARRVLEPELANIAAGWDWMLTHDAAPGVTRFARACSTIWLEFSPQRGVDACRAAVTVLDTVDPPAHVALGYALVQQARLQSQLQNRDLLGLSGRGLAHFRAVDHGPGLAMTWPAHGLFTWLHGEFDASRAIFSHSEATVRMHGTPEDLGYFLAFRFLASRDLYTLDDLRREAATVLPELRRLGDVPNLCLGLTFFGGAFADLDKVPEAEQMLREAVLVVDQASFDSIYPLATLAELALRRGDLDAAVALADVTEAQARRWSSDFYVATALGIRGRTLLEQGRWPEAQPALTSAVDIARGGGLSLLLPVLLTFLAEGSYRFGDRATALVALIRLSGDETVPPPRRRQLRSLLSEARLEHDDDTWRDLEYRSVPTDASALATLLAGPLPARS